MINLLPLPEKKTIRREYYRRLIVLSLKGFLLLAAVAAIPVLPVYLRMNLSENVADARLAALAAGRASSLEREVRASVTDINQKLSIFALKPEWNFSREILQPVLDHRGASIQLNSIFAERTPAGAVAKLRGQAADRDKLLGFRQRLEAVPEFARVDLPISNFVKGRNIEFSLEITLAEKK